MSELQVKDGRASGSVFSSGSDLDFQNRWWRVERVIWIVMSLILVAGVAGLFGRGPLAKATTGQPGSFAWVEYERFARFRTPTMLVVHLTRRGQDSTVAMTLSGEILQRLPTQRVIPQPKSIALFPDGTRFTFAAVPGAGDDTVSVRLVLEPGMPGRSHGAVSVAGMAPMTINQLVYP